MNTSQNSQNPYVAGPPVYGKNFYGRSKELGEVLDGTKKFIWFISTRRMGKTSLLRQIAYLCQHEPKYNDQYRCLFWDLQGLQDNPNFERLYKKLILQLNQPYIPEIDFRSLESNQSCAQVIESCIEAVSQKGLTLLLLIDETDTFLDLVEKGGTDFLDELLDCLQLQGIRTVITSTYKLYQLASKHSLLDHFVPRLIDTFNREEGKALISMANISDQPPPFARDEQVIDEILDKSNYSPYFIQTMCYYLYPDKDITDKQIWDKIFDVLELEVYFKSDFSGLNNTEKAILCFMINKEEKNLPAPKILTGAKEIMPKGIEIIPTQRSLDVMTSLNILRHKKNNYYIGNPLFRSWLIRDKDNLFRDIIPRADLHVTTSTERPIMQNKIKKIVEHILALMELLKDLQQEFEKGLDAAQYYRLKADRLTQKWSVIEDLNEILSEKGAGALADVVRKLSTTQEDRELRDYLERVAKEGESERWGAIIHKTLEIEKGPMDQTVLNVALKVALSFDRPNQT
jgi:hypothetical protein